MIDSMAMDVKQAIRQHMAEFQDVEDLRAALDNWLQSSDGSLPALDQALEQHAKAVEEQHRKWLRSQLGQSPILPEEFDPDDLTEFWGSIDELSDKMLAGEVPIREDSAALPL